MKEFVVCEEIINKIPSKCYTIRDSHDCSPGRFIIIDSFDTYEEADIFIHNLRKVD